MFRIGTHSALATLQQFILADLAGKVILVGQRTTHRTTISRYLHVRYTDFAEQPIVRRVHRFVRLPATVRIDVERVQILHEELFRPHQPKPGLHFIPEFGRYLIKPQRKLSIGDRSNCGHQCGDGFFVSLLETGKNN